MKLTFEKVNLPEFGVTIVGNVLYICASLFHYKNAGIRFINLSNGKKAFDAFFLPEHFFGNVVSVKVKENIDFSKYGYIFLADDVQIIDPYSRVLAENKEYSLFSYNKSPMSFNKDSLPFIPYEDSILYTLSVRGYTMLDKRMKKNKGTFVALEKKLPYFCDLGVTSLCLMPIYENYDLINQKTNSMKHQLTSYREKQNDTKKVNYWGFGKAFHFAIKASLSSGKESSDYEFKHFVMSSHKNGLEILLMMQFEDDDSISYILDVLKYYVINYHVDGFRLIGANISVDAILANQFLKNTKIIYNNYSFKNYKPIDEKNRILASSSDDYMNITRRFLKGDEDLVSYFSYCFRDNGKYFSPLRFITDFSGFTLNDLYSYSYKRNEANNEDNKDGTDYNYSWNCSAEGESPKASVLRLRQKMFRNAMLSVLLAQGTPMLREGDEFLNTQYGNNNPYCQDNEIGWVIYKNDIRTKKFWEFTKNLIAFRKRHVILHQRNELQLLDYMSCRIPDVSFHSREAFKMDTTPVSRSFGILYCGEYAKQYTGKKEDSLYIIFNMHWQETGFVLPINDDKHVWKLIYSSDGSTDESFSEKNALLVEGKEYIAKGRTVSILMHSDLTSKK